MKRNCIGCEWADMDCYNGKCVLESTDSEKEPIMKRDCIGCEWADMDCYNGKCVCKSLA